MKALSNLQDIEDLSDFHDLQVGKERITPEIARNYLEVNYKDNRNASKRRIQEYVTEMRQGRFKISNSAICFDREGFLIEGQHRLHAVVLSGTTQSFVVVRNMPEDSIQIMDIGVKRDIADRITLMGTRMTRRETCVIRHCMMNLDISGTGTNQFAHNRHDNQIKFQFEKHSDFFKVLTEKKMMSNSNYKTFMLCAGLKIYIQMKNARNGAHYPHGMDPLDRALHWLYLSSSPMDCMYPMNPNFDRSATLQHEIILTRRGDYIDSPLGKERRYAQTFWNDQVCYRKTLGLAFNFMKGIPTKRATIVKKDPFGDFSKMPATNSKGFHY